MEQEYFEDLNVGDVFRSEEYPLSAEEIIHFAEEWNPRPMHMDASVAEKTEMGGLFAAGAHLIAITGRILPKKIPSTAIVAGLGIDKLRFQTAARPGDVLVLEREVMSKRESSSRPAVGIVGFEVRILNQRGDRVMTYLSSEMVSKRPEGNN